MPVQDDSREIEVRNLFGLYKPKGSRGDTDAEFIVNGTKVAVELKSTTAANEAVTTVRDFSMDHVLKWRQKHWIIGFYDKTGKILKYCKYGSPSDMSTWIEEKANYIKPDIEIAQIAPYFTDKSFLHKILGEKDTYSYKDAKELQKRQYLKQEYLDLMDKADGYSEEKMLSILQDRLRYLILRGSTLNNPHIPGSYFTDWPKITANHHQTFIERVKEYFQNIPK